MLVTKIFGSGDDSAYFVAKASYPTPNTYRKLMKTSELIVLTDYEMENIQGGLTAARAPTRRPLFRLILLLLSAILGRSVPTPAPEL